MSVLAWLGWLAGWLTGLLFYVVQAILRHYQNEFHANCHRERVKITRTWQLTKQMNNTATTATATAEQTKN